MYWYKSNVGANIHDVRVVADNMPVVLTAAQNAALAQSSAIAAEESANEAAESELNALEAQGLTQSLYDGFFSKYKGVLSSPPLVDLNDGDLYFDSNIQRLFVYSNTAWHQINHTLSAYRYNYRYVATAGQIDFSANYESEQNIDVFVNGVRILEGLDFVAVDGEKITLQEGADLGDSVDIIVYGAFSIANAITTLEMGDYFDFVLAFDSAEPEHVPYPDAPEEHGTLLDFEDAFDSALL